MKPTYTFLSLLIFNVLVSSTLFAQTDEESARSVVKIVTSFNETENGKAVTKISTATAWCWKEPTLIVTALHAVAGCTNISVSKNNEKSCNAKVINVLREADLALLRLDADLGLKPLLLETADPNSKASYSIWGYPHAVYSIQGDGIRFSRSLDAVPTLNSILTGNDLKHDLKVQGFPLPEAHIFRISSTIQPGHSGAPIFTQDGKVIGIADGGLRGGTARINWAMPASFYVPKLLTSTDAKPQAASMQVSLYSSSVTVKQNSTSEETKQTIKKEASNSKIENGKGSVDKTWVADYKTIYKTLDDEDKKDLDDVLTTVNIDMSNTKYDIYEDFKTSSTIAVPHGSNLIVQNGWYYATSENNTLSFYSLPYDGGTYEFSKTQITATLGSIEKNFNPNLKAWVKPEDSKDKWIADVNAKTSYWEIERTDGVNTVYYTSEQNGSFLLVAAVVFKNDKLEDAVYLKKLIHFMIAAQVSSFDGM